MLAGAGNCRRRGVNQSTQQGFIADNLDVVLDAGAIWDTIEQSRDVRRAANCFEFAVTAKLLA